MLKTETWHDQRWLWIFLNMLWSVKTNIHKNVSRTLPLSFYLPLSLSLTLFLSLSLSLSLTHTRTLSFSLFLSLSLPRCHDMLHDNDCNLFFMQTPPTLKMWWRNEPGFGNRRSWKCGQTSSSMNGFFVCGGVRKLRSWVYIHLVCFIISSGNS